MMVYSIILSGFLSHNWTSKYIMVLLMHRYRQFVHAIPPRLYIIKINVLALHMVMQNENQCSNIT